MGRRVLFCRRHGRGGGSMNAVEAAKEVVLKEASALSAVAGQIGEAFERMADAMRSCTGKVVIIGMGKSGHVANKMAATLSSLGTCSISLHPGECMHGDLGMIDQLGFGLDELMACGDGLNDIPMLACAGLAVAMDNAYPETKAHADWIAPSNEEDGVAAAVDRFVFGGRACC